MTDKQIGAGSSVSEAQQQLAEFSQTTFTDLQHDFHELNHEIGKDSVLEPFRHEYAKLFGILQKSMTNQARYIEKGRVIESEIVGNKSKVRTVSKLAEEDSHSISNLNDERNKKKAALNESLATLRDLMEENELVSNEITSYENELERCILEERGQKDELGQLKQRKAELTKKCDELNDQIPQLKESNKVIEDKKLQKDKDIAEAIAELNRIEVVVKEKQKEDQEKRQVLLNLEKDRKNTKTNLEDARQNLKVRVVEVAQQQEVVSQIDKAVKKQKWRFETVKNENQEITDKCLKFQKDLSQLNDKIVRIEKEIADSHNEMMEKQKVAEQKKKVTKQQDADREKSRQHVRELQEMYENLRKETDAVRTKVDATEDEIIKLRRNGEFIRKQIDTCTREENSKLKKKEGEMQRQTQEQVMLQLYKNQSHNIECEISIIKQHLQETQKKIYAIETEKEHYSEDLSAATSQYLHGQEILKDISAKIAAKTAEIVEGDKRVSQQQAMYEKVRSEREINSKKVKEVEAEITELENNFGRMKFAIEQHKEDIHRKDVEKRKDIESLKKAEDEDSELREKLTQVIIKIDTLKSTYTANEAELSKHNTNIRNAEVQLKKQDSKLKKVKKLTDSMSNRTVENEVKKSELKRKQKIVNRQIKRGDQDSSLMDIEISKIEELINKKLCMLEEMSSLDQQLMDKRAEVHIKQKELMQLRAERAAMEEELAVPINIHRWTLLQSSDPKRFDMLKRYQELQSELIESTKSVAELQDKIKERETVLSELSAQVRRKPGLELESRVNEFGDRCKKKKFDLEETTKKLELYRDQVLEYRKDLSDVKIELINERNRWIKQKKRQIRQEHERDEMERLLEEHKDDPTFTATEAVNKILQPLGVQLSEIDDSITYDQTNL